MEFTTNLFREIVAKSNDFIVHVGSNESSQPDGMPDGKKFISDSTQWITQKGSNGQGLVFSLKEFPNRIAHAHYMSVSNAWHIQIMNTDGSDAKTFVIGTEFGTDTWVPDESIGSCIDSITALLNPTNNYVLVPYHLGPDKLDAKAFHQRVHGTDVDQTSYFGTLWQTIANISSPW